jgi:small-conductance mechanosensitive channel
VGRRALEEWLMKVQGMHTNLRVVVSRTARAVLILVAVLMSLSLVGIDLTVLSVFGGALGVGLGSGLAEDRQQLRVRLRDSAGPQPDHRRHDYGR